MRRADRLFQIIQILRGAARPVTAAALADELEISIRTVYRDIADLMAQRVPIRGEAGVGYVMESGYDMPPLMLTPDEVDAAVLGASWVASRSDPALARSARDLLAKIAAVVPEDLRPLVLDPGLAAPTMLAAKTDEIDMARVRTWIRRRGKLRIEYEDHHETATRRVIWPIALAYFEAARLIVAWCELRQDFRHFRTDRIRAAEFLEETYDRRTAELRAEWWRKEQAYMESRARESMTRDD